MLRKAGWQEGTGLGANQQGPKYPISLAKQSGKRGIGAGTAAAATAPKTNTTSAGQESSSVAQLNTSQPHTAAPQVTEPLDVKVKRHRQVLQTEADEAAEREMTRCAASQL
jgi:hypothetical protein